MLTRLKKEAAYLSEACNSNSKELHSSKGMQLVVQSLGDVGCWSWEWSKGNTGHACLWPCSQT